MYLIMFGQIQPVPKTIVYLMLQIQVGNIQPQNSEIELLITVISDYNIILRLKKISIE